MSRTRTTLAIDSALLRATKEEAARTGRREYEVVEDALRRYLGLDAIVRVWATSDLSEEEALRLAYEELHEARK